MILKGALRPRDVPDCEHINFHLKRRGQFFDGDSVLDQLLNHLVQILSGLKI